MFPPAHKVDQCWGIPVVATFSAFFVFLAPSCAGLLYVLFMEKFGVSHEMAAWPQSTYMVMSNTIEGGSCLFRDRSSTRVIRHDYNKKTAFSGAKIRRHTVPEIGRRNNFSGRQRRAGAGISMISLSLYLLVYFDKYRATATAFKYAGWAASGIIGPTFLGYIAENYGPQGALLFVGAMALQAVPLVMLLGDPQPLSMPAWCTRVSANTTTRTVTQNDIQYSDGSAELTPKRPLLPGKVNRRYNTNEETDNHSVTKKSP
ncbi:hypothetical protein HPB51_003331 [Rhipicephalus microplus]|uniref:Monocarboxylate transporter n=1 Tax=Rhipicephalus microplus TaxID=6941 RepID=A0A9J6EX86_RHIMP|nr:hypothetical protein HPB51_003331 [Rhipicephalus microplus]